METRGTGRTVTGRIRRFLSDYRWYVLGLLAATSFVLGYVGYWQYFVEVEHHRPALSAPLYGYVTLVVLSGPVVSHVPPALDIARFLTPAVAGSAGLTAVAQLFRQRWQEMRIPRMRRHVVVCGLGDVGSAFLRHLREQRAEVVVIESDPTNPRIPGCRGRGVPVIVGDAQGLGVLQSAGIESASQLLAVCDQDAVNTEIIATASELVSESSAKGLRCLARIGDPDLCSLLRTEQQSGEPVTTVDFFNTHEISARLLLDDYPISADGQRPHILIGHLGALGAWVIWHAARDWHHDRPDGDTTPLPVTVLDDDAQPRIRTLIGQYPELKQACAFVSASACVGDMRQLPRHHDDAKAPPVSRAYVTADRDQQAVGTALKLRRELAGSIPLVVALSRSHGIARRIRQADTDSGLNIDVFPTLERTCTVELIRGGSFETIAHAIHRVWRREQIREGKPAPTWAQLDASRKQSNRDQALDITAKLRSIGCDIAPFRDWETSDFDFSCDEIETLAAAEHDRWWKDRVADGWTSGPKDVQRKQSEYLVPWEDLPAEIAEYDRIFVREIPAMLGAVGLQVVRGRVD